MNFSDNFPADLDLINSYSLTQDEEDWWGSVIKEFRGKIVLKPKEYIEKFLASNEFTEEKIRADMEKEMRLFRDKVWFRYLADEQSFHNAVLVHLIEERQMPRDLLEKVIDSQILDLNIQQASKEELIRRMANVVGEYTGKIMPYIYQLSLSTTQSRRSRAGTEFELLIEQILMKLGYEYNNQSALGSNFFQEQGLTKLVDTIVPSKEKYLRNRAQCIMISAKTTLRERWGEVVEELNRTNLPHIYLLTLDDAVSTNTINSLSRYNITLVVFDSVKDNKFPDYENVIGFNKFFLREIPHCLSYWN